MLLETNGLKYLKNWEDNGKRMTDSLDKQKIVVVIMGQDCEKHIGMCLESVKDADAIVYCDGGSTDNTLKYVTSFDEAVYNNAPEIPTTFTIIQNPFDQEDKEMNGKQRNFYLEYVKEHYPGWWCLALDSDEVVEDLQQIIKWINKYNDISDLYPCVSVKMRHFIGDLGHEDTTVKEHMVLHRLFKITKDLYYPLGEHSILLCKDKQPRKYECRDTTIWHLAYIPNMWEIKKRYDNHMKKSEMHTPDFLKKWYYAHLFGKYPRQEIQLTDIPQAILSAFEIDKDEFYFANRGIELKHSLMVKNWYDYFKPKSVLDLGCGRGPYLYFWKWYIDICKGIELSNWAVNNAFCNDIEQGDITKLGDKHNLFEHYSLVTAVDVLEHLNDEELDKALKHMAKKSKRFLFSIPFIGDPHLENDKTHKQFRTKDEWKKLITKHGIKVKDAPTDWMFHEQILVGEKAV